MNNQTSAKFIAFLLLGGGLLIACAIAWTELEHREMLYKEIQSAIDQKIRVGMSREEVYAHLRSIGDYAELRMRPGPCSSQNHQKAEKEMIAFPSPLRWRSIHRYLCFDASGKLIYISTAYD